MEILKSVLTAALAAAWAFPAFAAGPASDFSGGFSLEAALPGAGTVPEPKLSFISKLRATKDCEFITFKAGAPGVSRPASLNSYVFEEVCEQYQDGRHCFENLLRKEHRKVTVELTGNRAPLPWEREVFGVCLEDTSLSVEIAEASHRYRIIKKPGLPEYRVEAFAESKIPASPDPAGITAGTLEMSEGPTGLKLKFSDKWGAFYAASPGEKTVLRLTLKQDNPAWFDGVLLDKELELAPGESYELDFAQFSGDFRRRPEPGRQYYVKWGFSRRGAVSKGTFMHGGETPRTVFLPR